MDLELEHLASSALTLLPIAAFYWMYIRPLGLETVRHRARTDERLGSLTDDMHEVKQSVEHLREGAGSVKVLQTEMKHMTENIQKQTTATDGLQESVSKLTATVGILLERTKG